MAKIPQFTREEYDEFGRSIKDGSFFEESRKFYTVVYMSILPERVFYIVLTVLSCLAAMFALVALIQLTPIQPTVPLLFPMKDVIRDVPIMSKIRHSSEQPVNDALQRYFVKRYVEKREDYDFDAVRAHFRFLSRYSSPSVMQVYRRYINPSSARSPLNLYGRAAKRFVKIYDNKRTPVIDGIVISRLDRDEDNYQTDGQYVAKVKFTAFIQRGDQLQPSNWEAQITFDYTQLKTTEPDDPANGELKVDPMKFTVTDYTVIEDLPSTQ